MMGDISQTNTATAEANAVKLSGNTLNVNITPSERSEFGLLARIIRQINPAYYERREAEARSIKTESVMISARRIFEEFPNMTERRALMEAMGYRMTNEQADNVVEVLEGASERLASQGSAVTKGLLPESRDAIFEGSKTAYDETVRSMWEKLIAEEATEPGKYSKRTMSILSIMDRNDALLFKKLCSTSLQLVQQGSLRPCAVLNNMGTRGYNFGFLSLADLDTLASLGLISMTTWVDWKIVERGSCSIPVNGHTAVISNPTDVVKSFRLSSMRFLNEGEALASLCDMGTYPRLKEALEEIVVAAGLKMEWR